LERIHHWGFGGSNGVSIFGRGLAGNSPTINNNYARS
jgi:hypothetical protein